MTLTFTRRARPVAISDAPEHRSIPIDRIEYRDDAEDENLFVIEGYASTFEEYEMYGGPSNGYGYIERIDPGAFDKTLREKPDLHFLINHAGTPLARTKSGTCVLEADKKGLKVVATLDKRDPDSMGIFVKMERGDMDEMSFAFRVKAQEWRAAEGYDDDNHSYRTITEVSLHKGDVSIVNFGANPDTSAGIRSAADAVRYLAECPADELAEVRSELSGEWLQRVADGIQGETTITNIANKADDETVRTYEWLTAEATWRADVLSWLNAERAQADSLSEWLAAEEQYRSDVTEWLEAEAKSVEGKGISLRYALALAGKPIPE